MTMNEKRLGERQKDVMNFEKIKPINFGPEMILTIADNRKTQTRRPIKNISENTHHVERNEDGSFGFMFSSYGVINGKAFIGDGWEDIMPKYQPGDILWCREQWRIGAWDLRRDSIAVDYKVDYFSRLDWLEISDEVKLHQYVDQVKKRADKKGVRRQPDGSLKWIPGYSPDYWRPAKHMPPETARYFLEVTDVKAERLQDISLDDMIAEGVYTKDSFINIWNTYYIYKDYGWDTNPWVWVYSFKKIKRPNNWKAFCQSYRS